MNKDELLQELSIIMNKDNYKDIRKRLKLSYKKDVEKFIYYFYVWELTESNSHLIPDMHLRGKDFHIDHIIPISAGYKFGIPYTEIGDVNNLRILSKKDNFKKNYKTDLKLPIIYREKLSLCSPKKEKIKLSYSSNNSISKYPKGGRKFNNKEKHP